MIIDSHLHFWKYSPVSHAWISDELRVLRRNFLPEDLLPQFQNSGVSKGVAVQAAQTEAETDFLLQLAEEHDLIAGVVGWVDLRADSLASQLERWAGNKRLKGFRHLIQDEPHPDFMRQPELIRGLELCAQQGYTYDLLVKPHQLDEAIELLSNLPEIPIVLDHIAKPEIAAQKKDPWRTHIKELASFPHLCCKLSGMITEANWEAWTLADIKPYIEVILESFGPQRIMYGSDWPVCLLAGSYPRVIELVRETISELSPTEQADIWGETATRFYQL